MRTFAIKYLKWMQRFRKIVQFKILHANFDIIERELTIKKLFFPFERTIKIMYKASLSVCHILFIPEIFGLKEARCPPILNFSGYACLRQSKNRISRWAKHVRVLIGRTISFTCEKPWYRHSDWSSGFITSAKSPNWNFAPKFSRWQPVLAAIFCVFLIEKSASFEFCRKEVERKNIYLVFEQGNRKINGFWDMNIILSSSSPWVCLPIRCSFLSLHMKEITSWLVCLCNCFKRLISYVLTKPRSNIFLQLCKIME